MRMLFHFLFGLATGGIWWVWLIVWHVIKN